MNNSEKSGLPMNVLIGGGIVLLLAVPFVGRILWEETVLTCQKGPQMVGFSMAHTMPFLMIFGSLGLMLAHVWILVIGFHAFWRHTDLARIDRVLLGFLILTVALCYTSYRGWIYLMGRVCGPRESAAELLVAGSTPLDRYFLGMVLKRHDNVNRPVADGRSLLGIATTRGDLAMVRLLIARGADVNAMDGHSTPLNEAAEEGHFDIVRTLIDAGADPNRPGLDGFTPAGKASAYGHEDIAHFLDSRRATPTK
jgi:hypothetical protein